MKKLISIILIVFSLAFTVFSCSSAKKISQNSKYKAEVMKAESDFEKLVSEKGIAEGFYQFADSNAVIKREHDTLIIGKSNIQKYYSNPNYKNASVKWTPDYVEVSQAGEMAYTYGKYIWTSKDANGKDRISKGIFHTVWRKQKDGNWKYIWD